MNSSWRTFCLILLSLSIIIVFSSTGQTDDAVPKGKKIKEPLIEQLFAPELPYENIAVIETKEDKRYVIIKTKETITDEIQKKYEMETLLKRKINIFRGNRIKDGALLISKMILLQQVSEMPCIVEYSEVKGERLSENKVEDVVKHEGKYIVILLTKDFGKKLKRVVVYPEKDTPCPVPPFIGKYPDSKSIACYSDYKMLNFVFVAKAKSEDIYEYYKERLKEHYAAVGFHSPESTWKAQDFKFPPSGIKMSGIELSKLSGFLELMKIVMKQDVTPTYYHGPEFKRLSKDAPIPANGLILYIEIEKGSKLIPDYSFIKVYYSIDSDTNRQAIAEMNKRYPDDMK